MLSVVQFLFRFSRKALGLAVLFEESLDNLDEERVLVFLRRTSLGCVAKIEIRTVDFQHKVLIFFATYFHQGKKVGMQVFKSSDARI